MATFRGGVGGLEENGWKILWGKGGFRKTRWTLRKGAPSLMWFLQRGTFYPHFLFITVYFLSRLVYLLCCKWAEATFVLHFP